jgi:N-acetylglutamate synthase-like GNAT family acetyltransferase
MVVKKPTTDDLKTIGQILEQWTELEEVDKYLLRIDSEINGQTEYSMNFWVIKDNQSVVGVGGLAEPLPAILSLAKSKNPGEIKVLYINDNDRNKGVGRQMIDFLEQEAARQGYTELFVRSAERYQETAYGFYKKMGYKSIGKTENNMNIFNKLI